MYGDPVASVFVERVVEGSGHGGGVADHQHLGVGGGHRAHDGVVDEVVDSGGFIDDNEDVFVVESLESFGSVGGETECEAPVRELELGLGHASADEFAVVLVEVSDLAPKKVLDLALGRRGGDDDGLVVGHEPPYRREGRGEGLARTVAGPDGDVLVESERVENLSLLVPRMHAETVFRESNRVVGPDFSVGWSWYRYRR